jgi:hypothetical protein
VKEEMVKEAKRSKSATEREIERETERETEREQRETQREMRERERERGSAIATTQGQGLHTQVCWGAHSENS